MPIVLFLTYKQFQMVDLIMLNTKLRCLWPELLLTVQQLQGPSLTDLQNLTCLQKVVCTAPGSSFWDENTQNDAHLSS